MRVAQMSGTRKLYLIAVTAFWGALLYALGWGLLSWLTNVPASYAVSIGPHSFTVNRWFDVVLLPIYLNLILSVYLWLIPWLTNVFDLEHDDLIAGLGAGLVVVAVFVIKKIVEFHKRAFNRL